MSAYAVIFGATLIWLAAVVSPGPNFLVVSRLALSRSRLSAIGATLGIAVGSLTYAALTLFGLGVLILRFAWLGDAVRIGAAPTWSGSASRHGGPCRTTCSLWGRGQARVRRRCCTASGWAS